MGRGGTWGCNAGQHKWQGVGRQSSRGTAHAVMQGGRSEGGLRDKPGRRLRDKAPPPQQCTLASAPYSGPHPPFPPSISRPVPGACLLLGALLGLGRGWDEDDSEPAPSCCGRCWAAPPPPAPRLLSMPGPPGGLPVSLIFRTAALVAAYVHPAGAGWGEHR